MTALGVMPTVEGDSAPGRSVIRRSPMPRAQSRPLRFARYRFTGHHSVRHRAALLPLLSVVTASALLATACADDTQDNDTRDTGE